MKPYILIVEDELPLITLLRYNLEEAGFEVDEATNGDEALISVRERLPDLVVLDWMLPAVSGIEVCRQFRRRRETRDLPVIMLTARSEEADRVRGLESGADDYITKPFSPKELIARVRAVLRRTRPSMSAEQLSFADIEMDLTAHKVTRGGRATHLGPTEFRLLRHFMEHPGRVFLARAIARFGLGPRCLCRAAHGRRAYPAPAQGAGRGAVAGRDPHGPLGRLRDGVAIAAKARAAMPDRQPGGRAFRQPPPARRRACAG